jgi:hypothetical protein
MKRAFILLWEIDKRQLHIPGKMTRKAVQREPSQQHEMIIPWNDQGSRVLMSTHS